MKHKTMHTIDMAAHDVSRRLLDLRMQLGRMLEAGQRMEDVALEQRLRERIKNCVSNPSVLDISARGGEVVLNGQVRAGEKLRLLAEVSAVPGVNRIEDRLQAPDPAEEHAGHDFGSREQDGWTLAMRAATAAGIGVLGCHGVMRRSPGSVAMAAIGLGLLARSAGKRDMKADGDGAPADSVVLGAGMDVGAAPQLVFDLWSRYENFPLFMSHVKQVRDLGEGQLRWTSAGPGDAVLKWNAVLSECLRPMILGWKGECDAGLEHAGLVRFEPFGRGTRITLKMAYRCLAGAPADVLSAMLGIEPQRRLDEDLQRMKEFIESRAASKIGVRHFGRSGKR